MATQRQLEVTDGPLPYAILPMGAEIWLSSLFTLESGIDVGQGINVGPGKFVKKNKRRALNKRRA